MVYCVASEPISGEYKTFTANDESSTIGIRVDGLESGVYSPMIIDGKLYFVNLDDDVRTARSSFSNTEAKMSMSAVTSDSFNEDNITFTLAELKSILPSYAIQRLMKHYNADDIQRKTMSKDQHDIRKLQDALKTLEPIDLMTTDDPNLIKLREMFGTHRIIRKHSRTTNHLNGRYAIGFRPHSDVRPGVGRR
ncbi:hypothetical protein KIN20_027092 [Parelaphostrongylus tenuis]|uniref:Uncharacterized protein n=1 Tax=Parelaphostrongylus tenuis TaxID=148309 RepID=A0AAD5QZ70_PARTN|nr:hypothetical protein KIN20_027092 [Parelaphostrongylus tenuis]